MAGSATWSDYRAGLLVFAAALPLGLLAGYEPKIAIGLALASAYALIALNDLTLGVALFVFASFFELAPFGQNDGAARLVLGISWFALIATRRQRDLELPARHPWITASLGALVAWAAVSSIWAESSGKALVATEQWAVNAVMVLIVFTAVRTRGDLGRILLAFLLGAVVAAVLGFIAPPADAAPDRLTSILLDPNVLGAALIAAAAISIAVLSIYREPLIRLLAGSSGVFCAFAMLLTGSRGALIATALALVAAFVLSGRWRVQILVASVAIVIAAVGYFVTVAPQEVRARITEPTEGEARIQEGRTTIWQVAWRAFQDNQVAGVGAGNFRVVSRHYLLQPGSIPRSDEIIEHPAVVHNAFLEILAELGVIGLLIFLSLVAACLGSMIRAARRFGAAGETRMQTAAVAVAIALVATLAANFFFSDEYGKQLWLLLALGPALLTLAPVPGAGERAAGSG